MKMKTLGLSLKAMTVGIFISIVKPEGMGRLKISGRQ